MTLDELKQQERALQCRIVALWSIIDRAVAEGRDARALEERWMTLLEQYDRVCLAIVRVTES